MPPSTSPSQASPSPSSGTPPRTCLITGGNAGIGRAAARQLARAGHAVILGCRSLARGEAAAAEIRSELPSARVSVLEIDMSLQRSISDAAERLDEVDVVIHNAAYFDVSVDRRTVTSEGIETTWATNYLGPLTLTERLLPKLRDSPSSRVVAVTSKGLVMHPRIAVDLEDPEYERRSFSVARAYYQSKLAHLAWMLDLADRLRDTSVRVHGVRVTNVKLDTSRYPGLGRARRTLYAIKSRFSITPEEMARTYAWLASADEPGATSGGYWDGVGQPASVSRWAAAPDNRAALAARTRARLATLGSAPGA